MGYLLCMYTNDYEDTVAEAGGVNENIIESSLTPEEMDAISE